MILFYGYNDGQALAIQSRRNLVRVALYSLILVIPFTVIGIITSEYLWLLCWIFPCLFFVLAIANFLFVKYNDEVFLKGVKTKHRFQVENGKIYKDGKEIKRVDKIKVYPYKNSLFMETSHSFFRIPDGEYQVGSRQELLQIMTINRNHTIKLRLPPKTEEEKTEILFAEINLKDKCRLFYSKDKKHIVYIYRLPDGFFSVGAEHLTLADEDELRFGTSYGWWEPDCCSGTSIFQTEELAYNEIKNTLFDYEELFCD